MSSREIIPVPIGADLIKDAVAEKLYEMFSDDGYIIVDEIQSQDAQPGSFYIRYNRIQNDMEMKNFGYVTYDVHVRFFPKDEQDREYGVNDEVDHVGTKMLFGLKYLDVPIYRYKDKDEPETIKVKARNQRIREIDHVGTYLARYRMRYHTLKEIDKLQDLEHNEHIKEEE